MPTKRCCCARSCLLFTDDFNRADAPTLGSGWNQPVGSIGIEGMMAKVTTGPASAYTVFEAPDEQMYVSIDTFDEQAGDVYEVWCNVVDESSYHFVRLIRNGATDSILEIGTNGTVLKSQTILSLTGTSRTINALISNNEFCGWITFSVDSGISVNTSVIPGGKRGGFHSNQAVSWFDDFRMENHFNNDPNCRYCACKCDDAILPAVLNAHLSGTGDRMSALDCDILLYWDRVNNYWYGTGTCCSVTWELILNCDPEELSILNFICTVTNGGNAARSPAIRVCDPLYIKFGPYTVTDGDLACPCGPIFTSGDYTIEITEV